MQLHSTPISEPAAIGLGVVGGLLGYAVAGLLTLDHNTRLWVGYVTAALINLFIGVPVNILMFDLLALIVVRPLSVLAAAKLLAVIINAIH